MKREVETFIKRIDGKEESSLLMGLDENFEYILKIAASTSEGKGK